jgi:hypothetical protein
MKSSKATNISISFLSAFMSTSFLILYSIKAEASIDYNLLASVSEYCTSNFKISRFQDECIKYRYFHNALLANPKYQFLKKYNDLRPGLPPSLVVSEILISQFYENGHGAKPNRNALNSLLDCMTDNNSPDSGLFCMSLRNRYVFPRDSYLEIASISPMGIESYDYQPFLRNAESNKVEWKNTFKSKQEIISDFRNWFLSLDKTERRNIAQVIDFSKGPKMSELIFRDAFETPKIYERVREKVENQVQEEKRNNLLN